MAARKPSSLVVALLLLAFVVLLVVNTGPSEPAALDPADGPAFVAQVVKPRMARPLFGLLPESIPGLPPSALGFDHTSPGAAVVHLEDGLLELHADGWALRIEVDGEGRVAPGTRLAFSLGREGFSCRRPFRS